jgi:hypothetical protein
MNELVHYMKVVDQPFDQHCRSACKSTTQLVHCQLFQGDEVRTAKFETLDGSSSL